MDRHYYLYTRVATGIFFLNVVYPVTVKLLQDRLAEDWLHSVLHLISGLLGLYAGWYAGSALPARMFTWMISIVYLALGLYGWFTPGLFLDTLFAIPLGVADNVFHLLLSVPALLIVAADLARSGRPIRPNTV